MVRLSVVLAAITQTHSCVAVYTPTSCLERGKLTCNEYLQRFFAQRNAMQEDHDLV